MNSELASAGMNKTKKRKRIGIIAQLYILVVFGMIIIALITYSSQYRIAEESVMKQMEQFAFETSSQVSSTIMDFPSHDWLFRYWYEHADEMDIEYDIEYFPGTRTELKYDQLTSRNPELHINYATEEEIEALSPEEQKMFAEIAYSWLNRTLNQIKRSHSIDHLYCIVTDTENGAHPYENQFFLLSAADPGETRGSEITDAFTVGKVIVPKEGSTLPETMKTVVNSDPSVPHGFEFSGNYADYYTLAGTFDDHAVLIGVSYSKKGITDSIRSLAQEGTNYAIFYQIILINIIMLLMYLYGIRPLKAVLENIGIYTESKDSKSVSDNLTEIMTGPGSSATRNNEIGQLSEDFIGLTKEIDHYVNEIETITAKNQRIETELFLASHIQESMLKRDFPLFPDRSEFDAYALMDPAREIGGDFYDFILIDEDHLAFVIADVSGKGVPAALFMMMAMIIVQSYSEMVSSPAMILEMANDSICMHNENDMFVTIWLGILEISSGKMVCSNAGHEYPVFKKSDGLFELIKDRHGFVIGAMPERKYTEYTLQMEPGDKLFVRTDGVREAMNISGELYGEERLKETLNHLKDETVRETVIGVLASIDRFAKDAEQSDDITMLCIEYKGADAGKKPA